jgi:hypothetical protein
VEEVDDDEEMIYSAEVKLLNPKKFTAVRQQLADKSVFTKIDAAILSRINEKGKDKVGILCN